MVEWDSLTEPQGRALGGVIQGRARETENEVRQSQGGRRSSHWTRGPMQSRTIPGGVGGLE